MTSNQHETDKELLFPRERAGIQMNGVSELLGDIGCEFPIHIDVYCEPLYGTVKQF